MPQTEEDLKRLQNGLPKDLSKCKLPQSILESICKNPLNGLSVDPNMDTFTKNLGESLGLSQSASLIEKLERQNNPTQSTAPTTPKKETVSSIDYDKTAKATIRFFTSVQNKLHYAVSRKYCS